jgi:HK97 family phage major capsid protein
MNTEELLSGISSEVKGLSDDAQKKFNEISTRMLLLEQKQDAHKFGGGGSSDDSDLGRKVVESEGFKALQRGASRSGPIQVGSLKTALQNALPGASSPLVAPDRTAIVAPIERRLTIRDVMPTSATSSNSIEFPKESSFTNAAAPQYSAGAYEGVTKAESALSFTLTAMPVSTIAHWIPVSRQLLDDSQAIQGYVNSRLLYGLKLVEEDELLNGSGVQGHLSGLVTNSTVMDTAGVVVPSDTYLDVLRKAALQLQKIDMTADVAIMHPTDWDVLVSTKESGSGISSGMYIFANPAFQVRQQIWGMRVVVTNSMTQGQFIVMDSVRAGMIFDRQSATIEVSREHSDYFTRNLAAILVEERLALCVFNSTAVVYGGWPFGS